MNLVEIMQCVAEAIKCGDFLKAKKLLRESMLKDMENPEAYNLLGILYEKQGDRLKAGKFYRISYYMDQNFKPASNNLERVCKFWYDNNNDDLLDWGLKFMEVKK